MAISRAQLVKELEPGLNALFGMEYDRYDAEHAEIYDTESSDRAFEEEVMLLEMHKLSQKVQAYLSTMLLKHTQPVTHMRQSHWLSRLQKKQWKITCMTVLVPVTHAH